MSCYDESGYGVCLDCGSLRPAIEENCAECQSLLERALERLERREQSVLGTTRSTARGMVTQPYDWDASADRKGS